MNQPILPAYVTFPRYNTCNSLKDEDLLKKWNTNIRIRISLFMRFSDSPESTYFVTEPLKSAHLNSYISERSHKANNLSGDHTLVKIIAKLWDAYSFNYQLALPGQ